MSISERSGIVFDLRQTASISLFDVEEETAMAARAGDFRRPMHVMTFRAVLGLAELGWEGRHNHGRDAVV